MQRLFILALNFLYLLVLFIVILSLPLCLASHLRVIYLALVHNAILVPVNLVRVTAIGHWPMTAIGLPEFRFRLIPVVFFCHNTGTGKFS